MAWTFAGQWGPEAVIDHRGNAQLGALCYVYNHGTDTLATLWDTRDKNTEADNPVEVDSKGNLKLFADPGLYRAEVYRDGVKRFEFDVAVSGELALAEGEFLRGAGSGPALEAIDSGTYLGRIFADITHYGAVGEDATKDTAALHEALKSGLPVYVPPGPRFYIDTAFDSAVDAPTITDWVIFGAGRDRSILEWVGTDGETMLRLTTADGTTSDGVDDSGAGGRVNIYDVGFTTNATRGHTSQTYYSYTTTSTSNAGTQGSTVGLHLDDLSSQGVNLTRIGMTDFGTAVLCDNGTFLVDMRGLWIRWCNIGVDWNNVVTASALADGSSIERCAIGVRTRFASGNSIEDCVIQANYAGTDILTYTKTKYLSIKRNYFEASSDPGVTLTGTGVDSDDVTRDIFIEENFGLEVRCRNNLRDVWVRHNNLRAFDNEYSEQTGRRGIYLDDNRINATDDPFEPSDVTGAQADEVVFLTRVGSFRQQTSRMYVSPPGGLTTATVVNELVYFVPFVLGRTLTLDRMGVEVTSAGETNSVVRLGVYRDKNGLPDSLIVDAGTVAADSTGTKAITAIGQEVEARVLWLAAVAQGAATTPPDLRGTNDPNDRVASQGTASVSGSAVAYRMDSVSGALPATATIESTARDFGPRIGVYFT